MSTIYKIENYTRRKGWYCYWNPETGHFHVVGGDRTFRAEDIKHGEDYDIMDIMDESDYWQQYSANGGGEEL